MKSYRNTRICIYARTSAACHNDEGSLLAEQIDRLKIWCRLNEAIIVDTVAEIESGTARSAFQAMIAAATSNRRPYDAILVTSLSRLLRDPAILAKNLEALEQAKVRVLSIADIDLVSTSTASPNLSDI